LLIGGGTQGQKASLASEYGAKIFADNELFLKLAAYQRFQNHKVSFVNVLLLDEDGKPAESVRYGQKVTLRMALEVKTPIKIFGTGYHIRNADGMDIVYSDSNIEDANGIIENAQAGDRYIIDWSFHLWLKEGNYNIATVMSIPIDMSAREMECCDFVPCAAQFTVELNEREMGGYVHWPNRVETVKV
jgi:lipopolysaccharide transport system ATP-binding protein